MKNSLNYEQVMEVVLNALFDEYERLTLWNAAYRHAMAIGGDSTELRMLASEYARRDPDAFAALIPQVRARVAAWKAVPEDSQS